MSGSVRERGSEDSIADEGEEKFFVGLRLAEGIAADAGDLARHGSAIQRFLAHGLMENDGSRLKLTARGVMVSNEIFQEFLNT